MDRLSRIGQPRNDMLTINSHIVLAQHVTARCRRCGRSRELDLVALANAGHGERDPGALPMRCRGVVPEPDGAGVLPCGGRVFGFTVGAKRTGPGR